MTPPLCDFCGDELRFESSWVFPCRPHEVRPTPNRPLTPRIKSPDDWSACGTCKRLILAGERDKLAERGVPAVLRGAPPGADHATALAVVRQVQDDFWRNRSGPPRRETREEWERGVEPPYIEAEEWSAKFVPEGESSDIKIIVAEFATEKLAVKAFEDLARWSQKPGKNRSGFSVWRIPRPEDGEGRIVAAAVLVLSGLSDPIISRLRRRGGKLRDLPEPLKADLAGRMLRQAEQGASGLRRGPQDPPPSL